MIGGQAASLALYLAALAVAALATPSRGVRLFLALFALAFGIGCVNVLIEAVAFNVLGAREALPAFVFNTLQLAGLAAVAVVLTGKALGASDPGIAPKLTAVRVATVVLAYVVLYLAAGMAVYPFVKDFYAGMDLPSPVTIFSLQIVRGLIYLLSAIPLVSLGVRRPWLVLAIAFPLIAGLAPLAAENPSMPASVRAPHAIEIGVSNFIFGLIVGWLITPRPTTVVPTQKPA